MGQLNDLPNVADLSTALGVERRLIKNDFAFLAFVQATQLHRHLDQSNDLRIINSRRFITFELRLDPDAPATSA